MKRLSAPAERMLASALLFGIAVVAAPRVHAQIFSVVHSFQWSDGANPLAGLTIDGSNLYGTTSAGGAYGQGTVFMIESSGVETVLYQFTGGNDGGAPEGGLTLVGENLYGTTTAGGTWDAGTVFEIPLNGKERVLYSFTGRADGANPQAGLVQDAAGNLYGTTNLGGAYDNGTVFKLVQPTLEGQPWSEQVLHSFGKGTDGAAPVAGVSFDAAGNLYGTTSAGGTTGNGIVFQLRPSQPVWTENILHNFQLQGDGGIPYAGIVVQGSNLFGAATAGGQSGDIGGGTVFELTPFSGGWNFSVLSQIPGWGISGSFRNVLVSSGSIYATTHCDGASGSGTVYQLSPTSGPAWTSTPLYDFTGAGDGQFSFSNLVLYQGSLYGTTKQGGELNYGVVFKVTLNSAKPL